MTRARSDDPPGSVLPAPAATLGICDGELARWYDARSPPILVATYSGPLQAKAALHALGITADTPNPPGGVIEKDAISQPTGMQFAKPSALSLCSTLARGRTLPVEDQINSTRHHMCETNRLGITSVIDAGGGQNFPDGYHVIQRLHDENQLTVGIGYNLFAQSPSTN